MEYKTGCWSPSNAMKAYVQTLQLLSDSTSKLAVAEPDCVEYISALAAGNQARLMVDVSASGGLSPSTLALAVAARHTGGRLVCVRPDQESLRQAESEMGDHFRLLADVVDFEVGEPCEVIKKCKNVDFSVVDRRMERCQEILFGMDMNPGGSLVVLRNVFSSSKCVSSGVGKKSTRGWIESGVLPMGGGMEVLRVGGGCRRKKGRNGGRSKRTFLVYEE